MRRGDRRNATVVDVAERAQVSVATVSRVVNGNYAVRPSTRDRVLEAIDALHYVPNVQARELNLRHSTTIGVVVPSLYNMFFAEVIDGIEATVRQYHYSLIFNCAKNDPQQEMECVRALVSRNVAGIIVISPNTAHIEPDFYEGVVERTPLVFINNGWHQIRGASYVDNDERAGSRKALEYLMGLGHQRILFVRGVNSDSYTVKEESYRQLMQEKGWLDEQFIVQQHRYRGAHGGYAAAHHQAAAAHGGVLLQRPHGDRRAERLPAPRFARAGGHLRHGLRQ